MLYKTHLAEHEFELDENLLTLLVGPLSEQVNDGCLVST